MLIHVAAIVALALPAAGQDSVAAAVIRRELPSVLLFLPVRPDQAESPLAVVVSPMARGGVLGGLAARHRLYLGFLLEHAPAVSTSAILRSSGPAPARERAYLAALASDPGWLRAVTPSVERYRAALIAAGTRAAELPPQPRAVPWARARDVAVRFLYPYVPEGAQEVKGQVCGTTNGLATLRGDRDLELEAFAYAALFPEGETSTSPLIAEFDRVLAEEVARGRRRTIPATLPEVQTAVWQRMAASPHLAIVLRRAAARMQQVLPFRIGAGDAAGRAAS